MLGEKLELQREFEIAKETVEVQRELIKLLREKVSALTGETVAKHGNYRIFNRNGQETVFQIIRN